MKYFTRKKIMENLNKNLIELKEKHNAIGIKVEFESEYFSQKELAELRELALKSNICFAIKLGGFSSFRDLYEAQKLNTDIIIAPMVESVYAFEKFLNTFDKFYFDSKKIPKLYVSIETIKAVENLIEILYSPYFKRIEGVIIGRGDLANSMEINNVEDEKIFQIADIIKNKIIDSNKTITVGGKITEKSIDFLNRINPGYTETRKIIFQGVPSKIAIEKALAFERELIFKKEEKTLDDFKRIEKLKERIKA